MGYDLCPKITVNTLGNIGYYTYIYYVIKR